VDDLCVTPSPERNPGWAFTFNPKETMDPEKQACKERIIRKVSAILAEYEQILTDVASFNDNHEFKPGEKPIAPDDVVFALTGKLAAQRILRDVEAGLPASQIDYDALCRRVPEDDQ